MSAALGYSQVSRIEQMLQARSEVASVYDELLRDIPGVTLLAPMPQTAQTSCFVYVIRLDPSVCRNGVIDDLRTQGVPTRNYFSPIHLQPFFRERFGYREGDFPVTERVADSTLALPFHATMSRADIEYVVGATRDAAARNSK